MRSQREIAYLGPVGSYSYVVSVHVFGEAAMLVAKPSVAQVFEHVNEDDSRLGVVPLENSSGGLIEETVDTMGEESFNLRIQQEVGLRVQLALLGRSDVQPKVVYSHFAPLRHCYKWVVENLPANVRLEKTPSTTAAARKASENSDAAALAHPMCASLYGLEVLRYPVASEVDNFTQFAVIGHRKEQSVEGAKSSYLVELVDQPASLASFLWPFGKNDVNLTRIHSRPVKGNINRYKFFITIDGGSRESKVQSAWKEAEQMCVSVQDFGSYPVSQIEDSADQYTN